MNLKDCAVEDKGDHFVIAEKGKAPFRMAKKAMSKADHDRVQAFAHGGVVKMAEGGPVPGGNFTPAEPVPVGPMPEEMSVNVPARVDLMPRLGPEEESGGEKAVRIAEGVLDLGRNPLNAILPSSVQSAITDKAGELGGVALDKGKEFLRNNPGLRRHLGPLGELLPEPDAPQRSPAAAPASQPTASGVPPMLAKPNDEAAAVTKAAPMAREGSMTVAAGSRGPVGGGGLKFDASGIDKAANEQIAGLDLAADAARRDAAARDLAVREREEQMARIRAEQEQRAAENRARIEETIQTIKAGEIDPNRYWASRSTGQKAAGIIGLLVGGFGAGLTRGPNFAMEHIDKAIESDISAQEKNLENKKSLFNMYRQQGADDRAAHGLAKADLMDVFAAQMERAANQTADQKIKAGLLTETGKIHASADAARRAAYSQSLDDSFKRASTANLYSQVRERAAEAAAKGQAAAQDSAIMGALVEGVKLAPEMVARLDPKVQSRIVQVSPGKYALARNDEAAKQVASVQTAASEVLDLVREMREMRKQHGVEFLDRSAVKGGKSLTRQLELKLKEAAKLGALSGSDREMVEDIVANPTSLISDATFEESMGRIEGGIASGVTAAQNANLLRPRQAGFAGGVTASEKAQN